MHLSLNTVNDSFDTSGPIFGPFWVQFRRFGYIFGGLREDLIEFTIHTFSIGKSENTYLSP